MRYQIKKNICIFIISLCSLKLLFIYAPALPFINTLNRKLFDGFLRIETTIRPPPPQIQDILMVTIGNDTLTKMPQRWPFPRSYFAKAIRNLKNAGAKVIALDFIFLGESQAQDDALLKEAIGEDKLVILATGVNENGELELSSAAPINKDALSGVITKFMDEDGVIRQGITFLSSEKAQNHLLPSWCLQILRVAKKINLQSLSAEGSTIAFKNSDGEQWIIPVSETTKSFLIHFRANTAKFPRLSFYRLLDGDFDPHLVKDKIVLIGLTSSLFCDLHYTPIGWLPGVTLNANALLTLYAHNFIREIPKPLENWIIIIGVILANILAMFLKKKKLVLAIISGICLFIVLDYLFLAAGFIFNYILFLAAVVLCPVLGISIYSFFESLYFKRAMIKAGLDN